MTIQPVVEGQGEVGALPVLLRRLRDEAQIYDIHVNRPLRMRRSQFNDESEVASVVHLARKQQSCDAILILFDSDEDCPRDFAREVQGWAEPEAAGLPCFVAMAHREYEAWFLATIESLRGVRGIREDAESHPNPENVRGAKEQLEDRMVPGSSYAPPRDQPALSAAFDLATAHRRCRSFRRLVRAFGLLAEWAGSPVTDWPPPGRVRDVDEAGA